MPPEGTWTYDASHYPEPMSPLSADIWFAAMGRGIQAAARELRLPFGGFEAMVLDGWAYERELDPDWERDPTALDRAALAIATHWERELRPASQAITDALRALRPERGDPAAAIITFDRLVKLVDEQWRIHFLTVIPVHAARELLHDAYVAHFGKLDEIEPYRLIEGLPNETLEADEQLWQIAGLARRLDMADVVLELPATAALERLAATHQGREVRGALDAYLRRFGGRSRLHELSEPREAERPEIALETVRLFLEHPRDLLADRRSKGAAREELQRDLLARIRDPAERESFARLVTKVTAAVPLEESHAYYIDYPGLAATREALLGFGRRLVAEGRLDRSADVFWLLADELRSATVEPWGPPLQELVARRAAADAQARRTRPAPWLGTPPDEQAEVPAMASKFYGVPGTATVSGDLLRGTGASPGEAVGRARLVEGPEDFARVSAQDVLVCATTTPAWTPMFASIAGLVTDTGGILSHAAVIAREYALPAVVGTEHATRIIPDGALISVDGTTGEVRILPAASAPDTD